MTIKESNELARQQEAQKTYEDRFSAIEESLGIIGTAVAQMFTIMVQAGVVQVADDFEMPGPNDSSMVN